MSITPPRAAIAGSSARAATLPDELEPPSKSATTPSLSTRYAEPSPTANMETANRGGGGPWVGAIASIAAIADSPVHAPIRTPRPRARSATNTRTRPTVPTGAGSRPTCTMPPRLASDQSTMHTWSHAGNQSTGPAHAVASGHAHPRIAFGYAIASVAVDRGEQTKVRSVPYGCSDPKWTRTTGTLTTNAATPAASAADANAPTRPSHAGWPRSGSSSGIHGNQCSVIGRVRCRSAITQRKLSWNPGATASDGACTSIATTATASTASPCQSRPSDAPHAPTIAISAERIALAAGAITSSATAAATATGTARSRSSRTNSAATAPTTQPSTARLKPEIARMCASPAARKPFSIGRYPSSTSPSTSATSIDRIPVCPDSSAGTPASSASRMRPRNASRARSTASMIGEVVRHPATGVASAAESIDSVPTMPRAAAMSA